MEARTPRLLLTIFKPPPRFMLEFLRDPSKLVFYDFNLISNMHKSMLLRSTMERHYSRGDPCLPSECIRILFRCQHGHEQVQRYFPCHLDGVTMVCTRYSHARRNYVFQQGRTTYLVSSPIHHYFCSWSITVEPDCRHSAYTHISWTIPHTVLSLLVSSISESRLPEKPYHTQPSINITTTGSGADVNMLNGTVVNAGKMTNGSGWISVVYNARDTECIVSPPTPVPGYPVGTNVFLVHSVTEEIKGQRIWSSATLTFEARPFAERALPTLLLTLAGFTTNLSKRLSKTP